MWAPSCPVSSGTGPVGWGEGESGGTSSGGWGWDPGSGSSGSGSSSSRQQMVVMSLRFLPITSIPVDDQDLFVSPQ